jgi:hypothetical protein
MTIEARRHSPRVSLKEIAYVNFGPGNRGVILDVSEGGLRFKTASPLGKGDTIRFGISQNERTEGTAQLAWADESRTTGGLRFTTVPAEIREQIRKWVERGEAEDPVRAATEKALREEEIAAAVAATATRRAGTREPATGDIRSQETPAFGSQPWLKPARGRRRGLLSNENPTGMFPSELASTTETGGVTFVAPHPMRHRWAVAFLVLLIVLGAATAAAAYYYPSEARHFMSQMQSKVERFVNPAGKQRPPDTENASMAGVTRFEGAFEPGKSPRDPFAQPAIPPPPTAANPAAPHADASHAATTPAPDADAPKNNAETDLELAQTYLSRSDNPDEKAKAVQLLWLATEKGNVDAEMELADLYARGDGVSKSCVQARILLKAATAVNAAAAQPKLDALDQTGCS